MIEPHLAVGSVITLLGAIFVLSAALRASWMLRLHLFRRLADGWGERLALGVMLTLGAVLLVVGIGVLIGGPVRLAEAHPLPSGRSSLARC
ncbi:MAG TPA: hypothetical protein DCQ98_10365 [Planctomycetaceae bacterium]|nr:hypothetical protein [Planctomycetaceae bacterium]HRF02235.1 hypothetical protein [Pirellulaceae bacterium]